MIKIMVLKFTVATILFAVPIIYMQEKKVNYTNTHVFWHNRWREKKQVCNVLTCSKDKENSTHPKLLLIVTFMD